jgi:hypothetical protein
MIFGNNRNDRNQVYGIRRDKRLRFKRRNLITRR